MRPLLAFLILFASTSAFSQGSFQPLNSDSYHILDRFNIKYGSEFSLLHPALKPYSKRHIGNFISYLDSFETEMSIVDQKNLYYLKLDNSEWIRERISSKKPIAKYFYREPADLYSVNTKDFILKVNPVLQFNMIKEKDNSDFLFHNTRGFELRAYIKRKVGFYTFLSENQVRLPFYARKRIDGRQAVPGEGFYKNFRTTGYDYFSASGYVTFNIIDHFDIQFGHGKNFIGNGHRSILLSDFSNNYFYLKIQTSVWKIRYQNIFAEMEQQYERGADKLLEKKYAAFHHLNVNVTPWLDIGVFEGVIFNRSEHFELQYLNPLIFYRSIEQELGSPDNALLGVDMKVDLFESMSLYGQWLFDEFNFSQITDRNGWWANKFAAQAGIKYIDVFKVDNLDVQLEFNLARPYTYTHNSTANYTHYNQELAHPLGANFREFISIVRYQPVQKLNLRFQYVHYMKGVDADSSNWGGDIFTNSIDPESRVLNVEQEYDNSIGQGNKLRVNYAELLASYQIKHNIFADFSLHFRSEREVETNLTDKTVFTSFGLRMNMPYKRYDF